MALDPITAALDIGGRVIDRLWPDKASADAAKVRLLEMAQAGELARLAAETDIAKGQMDTNAAEAAAPSVFVSGWRPWIGWVCGMSFAWQFVAGPIAAFVLTAAGHPADLPMLDGDALLTVLLGMLGLGGLRTLEKVKGATR